MCSLFSPCVKSLQCVDCTVCLFRRKDGKDNSINIRVEKGPIHSTCYTLAHDVAEYRICCDAITGQESFQVT